MTNTPAPLLAAGAFSRTDALTAGLSGGDIDTLLRNGAWTRIARGVYTDSRHADDPFVRALGAARAVRAVGAVVSHHSAGRLHGLNLVDRSPLEHVTVTRQARRTQRGDVKVHVRSLDNPDITTVHGVPVTTVARTVRDLLLDADRLTALWAVEQAIALGLVELDDVSSQLRSVPGHPGAAEARHLLALADVRSESALESGVRLLCADAGLPPLDTQIPIFDDFGDELYRIDLGYAVDKLAIECDGKASHDTVRAAYKDRFRANLLEVRGWHVLRFTWYDLLTRPTYIVSAIREALNRLRATA